MLDLQGVIFSVVENLKSFNFRNMKSRVILIFGLIAISQGAIPRNRASFCLWFPEHCKSTTFRPTLSPTTAPTLDLESLKEEISQLESEISNLKTKNSNLDSEVSILK